MTRSPWAMAKPGTPWAKPREVADTSLGWRFTNSPFVAMDEDARAKHTETAGPMTLTIGETAEEVAALDGMMREECDEFAVAFERVVVRLPEVVQCHHVIGNFNYLLQLEVAGLTAYEDFHANWLANLPAMAAMTSLVTMKILSPDERQRHTTASEPGFAAANRVLATARSLAPCVQAAVGCVSARS